MCNTRNHDINQLFESKGRFQKKKKINEFGMKNFVASIRKNKLFGILWLIYSRIMKRINNIEKSTILKNR